MKNFFLVVCSLMLFSCSQNVVNGSSDSNEDLAKVIESYQSFVDGRSPFNQAGEGDNNAKLPDLSPEKLLSDHNELTKIFSSLENLDKQDLSDENQINFAVLHYRIKNELDSYKNKEHYMPLTAESGFHVWISRINSRVNFKTETDYTDYIQRLEAIPSYFQQQIAWMNKGIESGITQPKVVLEGFEDSIKAYIKEDVEKSTYYRPFLKMSDQVNDASKQDLQKQAKQVIQNEVMAAYQHYYDYMVETYKPNARDNIAATSLPSGIAYYDNRVKHYTTLPISYEEVHQTGLEEVARIRAEMDKIIADLKFEGDFKAFVNFLRTDEQFYAKTPKDLLKEAAYISKKMDAKLPSLFKTLPRTPYGVVEVPANIAPKYTTGRYSGPSRDDQSGSYWVNTYRLDRRPLYVLEALSLHEAVPGHHLQGSIAREMKGVPEFRNSTYISAFGEGWGLYSEYLGIEAGFYQDPYSDFGRLTYEMWRACRLVVDTGMHAKGWSRKQAMDYLANNTALSLHNVKTEIDRYISWPGQALSYKIGELTIKRLRNEAETKLGDKFDLREFHDELLKNGSMPLSMLEKVIEQYIETNLTKS